MDHIVSRHDKHSDFPVGTKVRIVAGYVDAYFFYGETGKVIQNDGDYLGIRVEFDQPRRFKDGYIQTAYNFNPEDLAIWGKREPLYRREGVFKQGNRIPLTKEETAAWKKSWR